MEKLPLTQVSPSHSHSSCASSRNGAQGYLYDDYAREIPCFPKPTCYQTKRTAEYTPKMQSSLYIVAWLAVIVFLIQLGASLSDVPSTRLLEDIVCHKYYHNNSNTLIPENQCTLDTVQGELNVVLTGALILGYLPGILVAIPYGSLADRRGRKAVLGLCVLGMVLSQLIWAVTAWNWRRWDLRYVWASSAALLIGGGESVAEAMVFAMVADVASAEKRAVYFQVEICAVLLAEAVAPFVASSMLSYSIWLPILVSPAIMTIGGLLLATIPETLEMKTISDQPKLDSQGGTPTFSQRARRYAPAFDASTPWTRFRDSVQDTLRLLRTRDVKLLVPTASLTIPVATVTMSIILRYIPLRFGWTLTQTGMILGVRTGFNILVLLVLLPALGFVLSKKYNQHRDLVLARLSAVLLVVGQVLFAAARDIALALAGLAVLTLGTGAPSLCRAALTRLVDQDSVGRIFGVLAVCEMVGYLVCGVGFGALYQMGMKLGLGSLDGRPRSGGEDWWLALVFYVAAVVYFWCGGMLWLVDAKAEDWDGDDEESLHSSTSTGSSKRVYEVRVLADGRVTRKCPSLENVSVAVQGLKE